MSKQRPTNEEKRKAAQKRARKISGRSTEADAPVYGQPVGASLFRSGAATPRSVGVSRTHTLGPIRITEDLAERVAAFGNDLGLNQSDTVRRLLTSALDRHERRKRTRKKRSPK